MPTEKVNSQSRQVGVRLPHELDARIRDYALSNQLSHGQAMIVLMRKGLGGCETPLDTRETPLTQLMARVEALEARVSTMVSPEVSSMVSNGVAPSLDTTKHYLGALCKHRHDWKGSGQSRRYISTRTCTECAAITQRESNLRRRAAKSAASQGAISD